MMSTQKILGFSMKVIIMSIEKIDMLKTWRKEECRSVWV